jgi:hypothetical protein
MATPVSGVHNDTRPKKIIAKTWLSHLYVLNTHRFLAPRENYLGLNDDLRKRQKKGRKERRFFTLFVQNLINDSHTEKMVSEKVW